MIETYAVEPLTATKPATPDGACPALNRERSRLATTRAEVMASDPDGG
jgi:hypothetical protein